MDEDFIERFRNMERFHDIDGFMELFAESAELRHPLAGRSLIGRDIIQQFWHNYIKTFRRIRTEFPNASENRRSISLEWITEATLPSFKVLKHNGVSVVDIADSRIVCLRIYYDTAPYELVQLCGHIRESNSVAS